MIDAIDLPTVAAAAAVGAGALRPGRPSARPLWLLAVGGLVFEVVHLFEHVLQAGYWALNPDQPPWATPWALAGRDALASAVGSQPPGGNELLHLLGNALFLAAVAACLVLARRRGADRRALRHLQVAFVLQGVHVLEHVVLTATLFGGGTALGVTTLFGAWAPDDPRLWALRVLAHFALNVVATVPALIGATRAGLWRRTPHPQQPAARPLAPVG